MHFTYKNHAISITQTLNQFFDGVCLVRIDDGVTSQYIGSFSDAISSAKQWIDTQ